MSRRLILQLLMPLTYMVCFSFPPLLRTQVAVFPALLKKFSKSYQLKKGFLRSLGRVALISQIGLSPLKQTHGLVGE